MKRVALLFLVSGAATLMVEVTWQRWFHWAIPIGVALALVAAALSLRASDPPPAWRRIAVALSGCVALSPIGYRLARGALEAPYSIWFPSRADLAELLAGAALSWIAVPICVYGVLAICGLAPRRRSLLLAVILFAVAPLAPTLAGYGLADAVRRRRKHPR